MKNSTVWLKWLGAGAIVLTAMTGCGGSAEPEETPGAKTGSTPGTQGYNQASDPSKKK